MADYKQMQSAPWDTTDGKTTKNGSATVDVNVEPKPIPASRLTNQEIVAEVHELHSRFQDLSREYAAAAPTERADMWARLEPVVRREHDLRREYTGRATPELKQDQIPEQSIGYGR